jgi:hypothetical protein
MNTFLRGRSWKQNTINLSGCGFIGIKTAELSNFESISSHSIIEVYA